VRESERSFYKERFLEKEGEKDFEESEKATDELF
jgi:hypothetical protein